MDRLAALNPMPWFQRNATRLGGLAFGAFATLLLGLVGAVSYSGEGLGVDSGPPPQVYTRF